VANAGADAMNYHGAITQALVDELLAVVHKYDQTMLLPTALGCLDLVKAQLIQDHQEDEDD
jgi:hypothetical protein